MIEKNQRRFEGVVVGVNKSRTIHVLVTSVKTDKKYQKQYKSAKKYPTHDENQAAGLGDRVAIEECRPLSKTKRWRLIQVIKPAK